MGAASHGGVWGTRRVCGHARGDDGHGHALMGVACAGPSALRGLRHLPWALPARARPYGPLRRQDDRRRPVPARDNRYDHGHLAGVGDHPRNSLSFHQAHLAPTLPARRLPALLGHVDADGHLFRRVGHHGRDLHDHRPCHGRESRACRRRDPGRRLLRRPLLAHVLQRLGRGDHHGLRPLRQREPHDPHRRRALCRELHALCRRRQPDRRLGHGARCRPGLRAGFRFEPGRPASRRRGRHPVLPQGRRPQDDAREPCPGPRHLRRRPGHPGPGPARAPVGRLPRGRPRALPYGRRRRHCHHGRDRRDHRDRRELCGPLRGHGPDPRHARRCQRRLAPLHALRRRAGHQRLHLDHQLRADPCRDAHPAALRRGRGQRFRARARPRE